MAKEGNSNDYLSNKEQQILSSYIKGVHLCLRKTASKVGAEEAWREHVKNNEALAKYAAYMEKLATEHWVNNESQSRISWTADFCKTYFIDKLYKTYTEKEHIIATKIGLKLDCDELFNQPKIKLLDVGSCYNPFKEYESFLDILPIDICPANDSVFQCDILNVAVGQHTTIENNKVILLQQDSFETVVFSFLLEYIPTSDLRISACSKAYSLLKVGGLLIICTPDSKHVGANAKLMKCWRYTLALLGFSRIHYSKYKFIHCMAFRKSVHKSIAMRWANLYKEPYMEFAINIPQDFNTTEEHENQENMQENINNYSHFEDMPFCDNEIL